MKEGIDLLMYQIEDIVTKLIENMENNTSLSIDELCDSIRLGLKEKISKNNFD